MPTPNRLRDLKLTSDLSCENLIHDFLSFTSSNDIFVVFEKGLNFSKNTIQPLFLWYLSLHILSYYFPNQVSLFDLLFLTFVFCFVFLETFSLLFYFSSFFFIETWSLHFSTLVTFYFMTTLPCSETTSNLC